MKLFKIAIKYALATTALLLPLVLTLPPADAAMNHKVTPMGAQRVLNNHPEQVYTNAQHTLVVNHKVTPMGAQRAFLANQ